ncbi:hypothetical protein WKW79_36325 [Variovorax robiniae]|uniref:Uncharacterized protein n=1 Tax=Variovorax robiniae TaxID=1836199 RepID=A0ABU8XJK1_9BURK
MTQNVALVTGLEEGRVVAATDSIARYRGSHLPQDLNGHRVSFEIGAREKYPPSALGVQVVNSIHCE